MARYPIHDTVFGDAAFSESDHPRDQSGQFSGGSGGGGSREDRSKKRASFASWLSGQGVHNRPTSYKDEDDHVFVHHDDVKGKRQQNQIAKEAKKRGMKIDIADKGAIFS